MRDLLNDAFPKSFRPYIAVILLTAACMTAYAQVKGDIGELQKYGTPTQQRIERKVNWLIWKSGGNPKDFE